MNSAISLCLILVGLCTVTHGHHLPDEHNGTTVAALKLFSSNTDFALELFKQLSSASPGKNVFFSPIIISAILSILSLGAKSDTYTQILEGLNFNLTKMQEKEIHDGFHNLFAVANHPDDDVHLEIGQALFLRDQLKPLQKFLDDVHAFYEAEVLTAKFQEPAEAEKQINDYIEKKTHGKIVDLVKGLDPDTALVLANYIVFSGHWKNPFNPDLTTEKDFILDDGTKVKVPMMFRSGWFHYHFDADLSCVVLKLDYNGTATAFFVLPDAGKMEQLEKALSTDILVKWAQSVKRNTAYVHLPKFNISTTYELKEPLSRLGITDVFSDRADLSGITEQPLKVSKGSVRGLFEWWESIRFPGLGFLDSSLLSGSCESNFLITHKAVMTLDESGTEAAAASAAEAVPMSLPPTFIFDHSFLFVMQETNANSILFVGKIDNPAQA